MLSLLFFNSDQIILPMWAVEEFCWLLKKNALLSPSLLDTNSLGFGGISTHNHLPMLIQYE